MKCFSRIKRAGAKNIIDTRWVFKFKWDQPTVDSKSKGSQSADLIRLIRARLTLRGFKDAAKGDIDRYAGTSSRTSQKVVVSEAVRQGWAICTTENSKAFLQEVTCEELSELTGDDL